jgi:hypothetical protein
MSVLKAVTVIFLRGYGARIVQAGVEGAPIINLLPFAGRWLAWGALAKWQLRGRCY